MATKNEAGGVVTRHEKFWFDDGDFVLQAENTQFKVHRFMLSRESDFFKGMLSLPVDTPTVVEGTESAPLFVPEVTASGMSVLLRFIYLRWREMVAINPSDLEAHVLAAHRLQLQKILEGLVEQAKARLPVGRRLMLALRCGPDDWILEEFTTLVQSFSEEAIPDALDPAVTAKIWQARHLIGVQRVATLNADNLERTPPWSSLSPPPRMCEHIRLTIAGIVVQHPRKLFVNMLVRDNSFVSDCPECKAAAERLGKGDYPPLRAETSIIQKVWEGEKVKNSSRRGTGFGIIFCS
ncbi:hypothetical protein EXIGLDRAFT_769014 [Exidia glandulosa HHB12029]|uniref:BTB domain-containing protein n=1 Tax=Exidia glandulosa HHB12029 TaxID=1314781 RepID=A0A165HU38_EXIGL|nr:hypothetical protein EXIGLDRAFT_769014 [Exidia glandulosa HHB12029]